MASDNKSPSFRLVFSKLSVHQDLEVSDACVFRILSGISVAYFYLWKASAVKVPARLECFGEMRRTKTVLTPSQGRIVVI